MTVRWLKNTGVQNFDISSNSLIEASIITEKGAWNVVVDDTEYKYNNLLAVTAISSFVWNHRMPYILDCYYRILPYITVNKWGWLYQHDYDIILKTIKNRVTGTLITVGYQTKMLQQPDAIKFYENCCSIILREQWFFDIRNNSILFLVPLINPFIKEALIRTKDYFFKKGG